MNQAMPDYSSLKRRYVGLDIFRIISFVGVCAFHTTIHLGAYYGILQSMSLMGAVFMTAFFLLSGYSLFINNASKNLIDMHSLKPFWIKRAIGIMPMYYITAILYILFNYWLKVIVQKGGYSILDEILLAPIELLAIQSNFCSLFNFSHNGGTWFISCILMCYLVYPLLQEVIKQLSIRMKAILILLSMGILFYAPFIVNRYQTASIYANSFFRILEFSIGVMLASLKPTFDNIKQIRKYVYHWVVAFIAVVIMVYGVTWAVRRGIWVGDYMLYSRICLPCFIVMLIVLSGVESKILSESKLIAYASGISYTFFRAQLFSNTICQIIIRNVGITSNKWIIALGWCICTIIAIVLHEGIEKPIKHYFRKKWNV